MAEHLDQVQGAFTAYAVERELGSGGMATVYLAHDKKHDRKVAIKILHAEVTATLGAERFLQEIRVTANLQHPHILGLIDSGLIGGNAGDLLGRPYYVMPYVEGESLRQRLDKEQQLPVSDAVRIATEVASALDYAHRHDVIHRDIKPENILLHDGSAVVADFGIALALTQAGGARMTQTGLSLGTPSYMSPEQAMGERAITARSDIYSLGAVTYEMLTGEPPFTGPNAQAIVARVMTEEPRPLGAERRSVPAHVAAAVSRSLEKVAADRFVSAHEFAEALNIPSFTAATTPASEKWRVGDRARPVLYGAAALALLFGAMNLWGSMRPVVPKQVVRYSLVMDSSEAMVPGPPWWTRIALAPDGSRLAYIGGPHAQLLMRPRNQLRATAIPGTEGAETPFFSPDGTQVGFLREESVQIVSNNGSPPIIVTDTLTGVAGASWGRDGFIYVDGRGYTRLLRVEAKRGAVPQWFTEFDTTTGEYDHKWPDVLPNGKGVIFAVASSKGNRPNSRTSFAIAVADIPSGKHRILVDDAVFARYAVSGHLLYVTTNRTLMLVPFDQGSMKITGEPTPLVEGMRLGALGSVDLAISQNGTLLYAAGAGGQTNELVWVTRDGTAQSVDPDWQGLSFEYPTFSPDGKQLAVARRIDTQVNDIWIKQLDRGPSIRLTTEGTNNNQPAWTPDGRSITFASNAGPRSTLDLWTKRADGSAPAALQLRVKSPISEPLWSPDGKWLIFVREGGTSVGDILGLRLGIDTVPLPLIATRFDDASPALSPDGRWLAYSSNESGQYEIYVVPFPDIRAGKWAVSTRGGTEPLWSHRGSELFYRDGSGNLVAVAVSTAPSFSPGHSTALFPAASYASDRTGRVYAVAPDDRRFIMIRLLSVKTGEQVVVVENWFDELKATVRK